MKKKYGGRGVRKGVGSGRTVETKSICRFSIELRVLDYVWTIWIYLAVLSTNLTSGPDVESLQPFLNV